MKFLHTMIRVKDIEKSLEFYEKLLGLKITRKMELKNNATLYYLADGISDVEIELTYNHQSPEEGYTNGTSFGHLALGTKNMDKFSEKLDSMGYKYIREPFILPGHNTKIAFVEDPDGRAVEIIEQEDF